MAKKIVPGQEYPRVNEDGKLEHNLQVKASEIRLTPKASSTGAEGTIFYDSDDDRGYVVGAGMVGVFSGLTKITVGTGVPESPNVGDLWVDTS